MISEISIIPRIPANLNANPPVQEAAVIYFPLVTLFIEDNIKFLQNIKQGFKITISWNKYRSEITAKRKNNNLDYLIDPTFRNINRRFVFSFSFDKHYMPLAEIKYFNALIDNKSFLDQPVKNKPEGYQKLVEMSRNKDYKTENLLGFCLIKIIINSLALIYQSKETQVLLNKLILQENQKKMMERTRTK